MLTGKKKNAAQDERDAEDIEKRYFLTEDNNRAYRHKNRRRAHERRIGNMQINAPQAENVRNERKSVERQAHEHVRVREKNGDHLL